MRVTIWSMNVPVSAGDLRLRVTQPYRCRLRQAECCQLAEVAVQPEHRLVASDGLWLEPLVLHRIEGRGSRAPHTGIHASPSSLSTKTSCDYFFFKTSLTTFSIILPAAVLWLSTMTSGRERSLNTPPRGS